MFSMSLSGTKKSISSKIEEIKSYFSEAPEEVEDFCAHEKKYMRDRSATGSAADSGIEDDLTSMMFGLN